MVERNTEPAGGTIFAVVSIGCSCEDWWFQKSSGPPGGAPAINGSAHYCSSDNPRLSHDPPRPAVLVCSMYVLHSREIVTMLRALACQIVSQMYPAGLGVLDRLSLLSLIPFPISCS